jgi:hypothetical protein
METEFGTFHLIIYDNLCHENWKTVIGCIDPNYALSNFMDKSTNHIPTNTKIKCVKINSKISLISHG